MNDILFNIKLKRKELGLSQLDMAKGLNITRSNYNRIENNHAELTIQRLEKIAKILNTDTFSFMGMYPSTEEKYQQREEKYISRINKLIEENDELKEGRKRARSYYLGCYKLLWKIWLVLINEKITVLDEKDVTLEMLNKLWFEMRDEGYDPNDVADFKRYRKNNPEGFGMSASTIGGAISIATSNLHTPVRYLEKIADEYDF